MLKYGKLTADTDNTVIFVQLEISAHSGKNKDITVGLGRDKMM